ncbi:MAG: hypothetical protein WC528_03315 [Patescibacteria group bacterium]
MVNSSQKTIGLDFILLFSLVFYFVIQENWIKLSSLFLAFMALSGIVSYYFISQSKIGDGKKHYIKLAIILVLIVSLVLFSLVHQIILRRQGADIHYTHDGAVQTEEASKFLAQGVDPYAADYRNTPFGHFIDTYSGGERENPAWTHYVYLPFLPVFSLPFQAVIKQIAGFFDQRMVYGLLFMASLFFIYKLPEEKDKKLIGLIIFAFNPIFARHLVHGFNDIFVFFWLIFSLYLLKQKKYYWSAGMLALACVSKQSAWLILPFYFFYLYFAENPMKAFLDKIRGIFKKLIPFFLLAAAIFTPFLIWGFDDFIDDIYRYPAGSIASNFPAIGYGFSRLFYLAGFMPSPWSYFPFWIFQAFFGLPLFYFLIKKQMKNNNLSALFINYGLFLLVFWFFSRFFNDNYISYLSLIFLAGYLVEEKMTHNEAEKTDKTVLNNNKVGL